MVRVLLFHHFRAQRVFFDTFQPTAITSTKDYLFLATSDMKVLVYSLELPNFPLLCQFPTISRPIKLICNEMAKCVLTIERKTDRRKSSGSRIVHTHSRAYFNWFKANLDEAVRTFVAGYSFRQRQETAKSDKSFLVVEIPTLSNVSAICCCPSSGNIAVASDKNVRLFRWNNQMSADGSRSGDALCDMEHFLDVELCMSVRGLVMSDSYLAVRSNLDVQVLKLVFVSEQESASSGWSGKFTIVQNRTTPRSEWSIENLLGQEGPSTQETHQPVKDDNCVLWSFDECSSFSLQPPAVKSTRDALLPTIRQEKVFKDFTPEPKEILGPVSEIPGHPVTVAFGGLYGVGIPVDGCMWKVKSFTMLYRRFRAEQLTNDGNDSATLHTLQLLPTYTQGIYHIKELQKSPLVQRSPSEPTLCGMLFLVSGPKEGFMYDVFNTCKLLSYYKYTCDTISVSACSSMLHAITKQGIETYTVRMYAAASDWIRMNAAVDWKTDQQLLIEDQTLTEQAKGLVNVMSQSDQCPQGMKSNAVILFPNDSCDDSGVSSALDAISLKSGDLGDHASKINDDIQSDSPVSIVEDLPSTSGSSVSNFEVLTADSEAVKENPPETKLLQESQFGSQQGESSPSDVTFAVDNAGKTFVRFSTGSHSSSPVLSRKGDPVEEDKDSSSVASLSAGQGTRLFAASNSMRHGSSPNVKLSEVAYLAAVNKLSSDCGWNLPVFDLERLRQCCPQPSLDICLIGMYPFVGSRYVMATEESVVLFTRASRDAFQRSRSYRNRVQKPHTQQGDSNNADWTVYLLQNMEPTHLYKAVMPLANRCQKHNAQVYHHLVCEQHLFLRTLCLSDFMSKEDRKQRKVRKMLCESAANLAELCARIPSVYKESVDYFTMSGLTLRDIVDRAYKSGQPVADGLIHFLDERLLGSDEPVTVSENTAKKIFKLYSKGKPSRVSEIILMSSLSGFSSDTALAALEDLKKVKTAEGVNYSLSPLDNLVRAVLYLHQCDPDHAQSTLCTIPKKELVEVLTTHSYLLHEDGLQFTPLAQCLRKHEQAAFMEVLLRLLDKYVLSLETLLTLLGTSKPDAVRNDLAIGFLEAVLNDKARVDSYDSTVMSLCGIYLKRMERTQRKRMPSSSHHHVPKGEGHFGVRHLWLDKLPPFQGSVSLPVPGCPSSKPVSPQDSPQLSRSLLFSSPSRRSASKASYYGPQLSSDTGSATQPECSCCCCNEDLLKLQALLCSHFVSSELCEFVLSKIEAGQKMDMTSVSLLCLPNVDRHTEAVATILEEVPEIILPYGEYYFGADIDKWSVLLRTLLKMCKDESLNDDADSRKEKIIAVLKGTLHQLSRIVTPREFLALLPDDGCVGFFLPYLQQCYSRCASDSVNERLEMRARQMVV
ncbi:uncharacterized protein [Montipora foliosa]|uniref:uncharacterized protein n=1 Tax=Montipora foliosa TaxID=591990 RepID=UPI0035F1D34E